MNKQIALLRGINVGGKRKILMADLRSLLETLGFSNVITYIQSGNVIFDSINNISNSKLSEIIHNAILDKFGFEVPVITRARSEFQEIINRNPFYNSDEMNINNLFLTLLKDKPEEDDCEKIDSRNFEPDKFLISEKEIFLFCEGQYHKSKMTNNFFEKKLKVSATSRNWKTILKLFELSKQ